MKPVFKSVVFAVIFSCLLFSCSKKDANMGDKDYPQAKMTAEISYTGDLSSQLVFASISAFKVKNANDHVGASVNLINDQTQTSDIIWNLKNDQFEDHDKYRFTSDGAVTKAMVEVAFNSDRPAGLDADKIIAVTVKIYFNGKLADEQTFSNEKAHSEMYTVNVK